MSLSTQTGRRTAQILMVALVVGSLAWRANGTSLRDISARTAAKAPTQSSEAPIASWDEFREVEHATFLRLSLDSLDKIASKPDRENPEVRAFIKGCLDAIHHRPDAPEWSALADQGEKLAASGCKDGLVARYRAVALGRAGKSDECRQLSPRAFQRLEEQGYPHLFRFMTARNIANYRVDKGKPVNNNDEWRLRALTELGRSWEAGELQGRELRVAFKQISGISGNAFRKKPWKQMLGRIQHPDRVDPWLMAMLRAEVESKLAWEARGGGYAKDVSKEGWRKFAQHGTNSGKELVAAWKMAPQRPEAARNLITRAMENNDPTRSTTRFWFEQCVGAQFDFGGAYTGYLWSIRPRWGGSHEEMLAFGRECLDSERWDTSVPLFYLRAIEDVAGELPPARWRIPFQEKQVRKDLDRLFEGMLSSPLAKKNSNTLRMQYAVAIMWTGDYARARELFPEKPLRRPTGGYWGKDLTFLGRSWEKTYAELDAYTGEHGDLARKADLLTLRGAFDKARDTFMEACQAYGEKNLDAARAMSFRAALCEIADATETMGTLRTRDLMHLCAWEGYANAADLLARGFHDVNKPNAKGVAPIRYARRQNHKAVEAVLRKYGANREDAGVPDWPEISKAAYYGNVGQVTRLIRRGVDLNVRTKGSYDATPLLIAVRRGHAKVAQLLMNAGADVNIPNVQNHPPLSTAIRYGHTDIARALIAKGADIDAGRDASYTPLTLALIYNQPAIALLLIEKGADVRIARKDGYKPITLAAHYGHPEVLKRLIEKGEDVNDKMPDGSTPLHHAAVEGHADCVRLLLRHGADATARDKDGETPLDVAQRKSQKAVVEILESTKR